MLNDFIKTSRSCIDDLLEELLLFQGSKEDIMLSTIDAEKKTTVRFDGNHFFLRTSTEYSSPQLTLEEAQGIIAARLLEVCGNYLEGTSVVNLEQKDLIELSELLKKPPRGKIIPFLLNTDDAEPDRYSNNPFKASIVESGQSAFPVATVKTSSLKTDPNFITKYEGSLISSDEIDFIERHLYDTERYVDFVDLVKSEALTCLSKKIGIDLNLPAIRVPIERLDREKRGDPLHLIIQESHKDYGAVETIYRLMGRSIKKKTTLLTTPHSTKGYGSKRSAKGRLIFEGSRLKQVNVVYRTIKLYPNMVDPKDLSIAKANHSISIEAKNLTNYDFHEIPSSPQFALYVVLSPENASLAHGAGAYAGSDILKSYYSISEAYVNDLIFTQLSRTNHRKSSPLVLNLVPEKMWLHPTYHNIDASIGCVANPIELLRMGMVVEALHFKQEIASRLLKRDKIHIK